MGGVKVSQPCFGASRVTHAGTWYWLCRFVSESAWGWRRGASITLTLALSCSAVWGWTATLSLHRDGSSGHERLGDVYG